MGESKDGVIFRRMAEGDEEETSALIRRSFEKYISHTYTEEGLAEFLKNTTPGALAERRARGQNVVLAVAGKEIVGVIAVRGGNHISLLFVDESRHRMGIAGSLVSMAVAESRNADPSLSGFTVNSSPFAVKFYERMGFRGAGPERFMRGMKVKPMMLEFAR
jgi:GNAT superfamily N-acetyltransferase